jgi:AcrR family transcriptional regulator
MSARRTKSNGRPRKYDASGRREQARRQHTATLEVARQQFIRKGYAATTVEAIAADAGVSPATVYKTYGGKAGLVRELARRALLGEGPVAAATRSDALRGEDVQAVVEGWGHLTAEVSPRVSPLALLLSAAAHSDAEAAALHAELEEARLDRMAENARFLAEGGHLRTGITALEARDVLWWCSSPEFYNLMVVRRRWTAERFGRLVTDTIVGSLL